MAVAVATWIVRVLALYLGCGLAFAIAFAWRGAARIDSVAAHGSRGFRVLLLPGAAALWPLLLARWRRASRVPR